MLLHYNDGPSEAVVRKAFYVNVLLLLEFIIFALPNIDTDWDDLFLSVQSNTAPASPPDPMKFISVYPPETGLMIGAEMPVKGVIPPAFPSFTLAQLQQGTEKVLTLVT